MEVFFARLFLDVLGVVRRVATVGTVVRRNPQGYVSFVVSQAMLMLIVL